ncbi:MAG: FHA domain-containing protein [Chromatiales bacterium]|jgi:hypothetical protein|nr:FHA domain-containing protein [Chromatiales bacterium]
MMKRIALNIDQSVITFNSLVDFEFCLDSRTEVPARRVTQLAQQPTEQLLAEARSIRTVEQRFMDVLADAIDTPASLPQNMRKLDRQLFSQDFRWRAIIEATNALPDEYYEFRQAAMVRYLQYLRSRQEALRHAYQERRRQEGTVELTQMVHPPAPNSMRETAIFDVGELPDIGQISAGLATLTRGEAVKIKISNAPTELFLSRHRFELFVRESLLQVRDEAGRVVAFKAGRNVLGRDLSSDVMIDSEYRDVSRRHLIVEFDGEWLQLTDLSSHGTKVAVKA